MSLSRKALALNTTIADAESVAVREQLQQHLEGAAQRLKDAEQKLLAYQNVARIELLRTDTDAMLYERGRLPELLGDIEAEKGRVAAAEQEIVKQQPILPVRRSVQSEEALRRAVPLEKKTSGQRPSGIAEPDAVDLSDPFVNPVHQTLALQIALSRTRLAGLERQRREIAGAQNIAADRVAKLDDLHRRELELARLQGGYELAKQVHAGVALRYEQSRTEAVTRMVQLQIVDDAIPPDRPLPKKRAQAMALGFTTGVLLALAAALAWNSRFDASRRAKEA